MPEYVRVKDRETGHHYSVTRERFDRSPELFQELKQDATDSVGDPLPPKYKTTVAASATVKQAAKPATSEGDS